MRTELAAAQKLQGGCTHPTATSEDKHKDISCQIVCCYSKRFAAAAANALLLQQLAETNKKGINFRQKHIQSNGMNQLNASTDHLVGNLINFNYLNGLFIYLFACCCSRAAFPVLLLLQFKFKRPPQC